MTPTIKKANIATYITTRVSTLKSEYETEWGRKDKLNYLCRLSELQFLANAFELESLRQDITAYMNDNI